MRINCYQLCVCLVIYTEILYSRVLGDLSWSCVCRVSTLLFGVADGDHGGLKPPQATPWHLHWIYPCKWLLLAMLLACEYVCKYGRDNFGRLADWRDSCYMPHMLMSSDISTHNFKCLCWTCPETIMHLCNKVKLRPVLKVIEVQNKVVHVH